MFKMKITLDRHGPRLMDNNYQHLDPPNFSLPSTFEKILQCMKNHKSALKVPSGQIGSA